MGKKAKAKKTAVRLGEIIRIESKLGMPPSGVYRVDGVAGDLIMLSSGEIRAGASIKAVNIVERNLAEPESLRSHEIEILAQNACDCAECRTLLAQKKALISDGSNNPVLQ